MEKSEWFEEWFNTPFYHILYQNRNEEEAAVFIGKLMDVLDIEKPAKVLDLACGKGRHAITLNKLGYNVTGSDLSVNSIAQAKKFENDTLRFIVQDMRKPLKNEKFDAILNLFTSFGYFDDKADNLKVLNACGEMLNKKGVLVIDFMNAIKAAANLAEKETKIIDSIQFEITRQFDGRHIFKTISFGHMGQFHSFTERVQALTLDDFEELLKVGGFTLKKKYGDYELSAFDEKTSDRLILIAAKK